ncbi:MAG: N-6 DNA methylase [Chromatiaceae bacterium]|nr:N-6 DNA methylase [Chromatiaceae bacterium]
MAERPLTRKKVLGSYYTDPRVVDYLVDWGMSVAPGSVMDPSCGDGRFLEAAARRGASCVIGCDLDRAALAASAGAVAGFNGKSNLLDSDFFLLDPDRIGPVDLVVGNPPFIRYQQFSGESRARALASALCVGARLTNLSASWAPFLLHGLQFLRAQGAMAMVVPAELAQTAYGITTLRALCANFSRIGLITFRRNWFSEAQQETFLLLAEGRGGSCPSAELIPMDSIDDLQHSALWAINDQTFHLSPDAGDSLGLAFLEPLARGLWSDLRTRAHSPVLGALGEVANGYVSGANAFFHCTRKEAVERGLPAEWLLPVARSIRSLKGLTFEVNDITEAERGGTGHHLILPRSDELFSTDRAALERFLADGERLGIANRYKCRVRNPWWQVPGLNRAEVLLPYMIGREPRSATNCSHVLYPNSLHGIRLFNPRIADRVAFALLSSFTLLGMELEGRSYGGGVLKLEPSEMQKVPLILPTCSEDEIRAHFHAADRAIRKGSFVAANQLANRVILKEQLGLSRQDIRRLEQAHATLLDRRMTRARSN